MCRTIFANLQVREAGAVARLAVVDEIPGRRIVTAEAAVRTDPDPTGAVAINGKHRIGGQRARLAVAVSRGLLLDLLATGDRKAVDAAFDRYVTLVSGFAGTVPRR